MTQTELIARRQRLGFTQAQLAQALGVASITVSRWERGVQPISETAARLLSVLTPPEKGGKRTR
jgi:DNA-binding transcriptional regulator YiaG